MPTAQALRLCPQAIVLSPRHKVYREYPVRMMAILSEYSPSSSPSPWTKPSLRQPFEITCAEDVGDRRDLP
jgi:hypothetical protein